MTFKQMQSLPEEEQQKLFKKLKKIRNKAKQTNFSCVYGAGPPKIAETAKIPLSEAIKLHTIYWERNKAVKEIAKHVKTKQIGNKTWLYNPLSGFWLYLENDKDKFSSLNQSTG